MIEDFGPYRVVRRIAVGGMAEIYLARQRGLEGLERTVVLKRILPTYGHNEEFVTMFLDEARLLAALSHPNIAQVFDLGRIEDTYYLVMEYVRGPNLAGVLANAIKQGKAGLPEKEALGIGMGIAEALAYVHSRRDELGRPLNIVHRDLNPANVVVSYDGAVKLIDFGIAKAATKVYETRTGVIKGTYGYIAPEQLSGAAPVDHRADVFALGVLLYEMCVGQHPFDVSDEPNLLDRILQARYKRPRQVVPTFPKELDRLIAACLSPHPEGRPQDVPAVIEAITAHLLQRGMIPTMGDVAALAHTLVPDEEGPAPLRPLTASHVKRPFGADPSRTIKLPGEQRGPTQKLPSVDDEAESSETLVAAMPVARRKQLAELGIIVPPPNLQIGPGSGDHDMSQMMTNELPRVDQAGAAAALASSTPAPAFPSRRPPAGSTRQQAARNALTLLASALLIVGVGVAAFLTARALGARDHGGPAGLHPTGETPQSGGGTGPEQVPSTPPAATLAIVSEPPGARVSVDGRNAPGVTPAEVSVPASTDRVWVRVSLEGYVTQEREVQVAAGEARFVLTRLIVDAGAGMNPATPAKRTVKRPVRRRWSRRR